MYLSVIISLINKDIHEGTTADTLSTAQASMSSLFKALLAPFDSSVHINTFPLVNPITTKECLLL